MHVDPCVQPYLECLNLLACVWLRTCVVSHEQMDVWYIQLSELRWTAIMHIMMNSAHMFQIQWRRFIYVWSDVKVEVWNQLAS